MEIEKCKPLKEHELDGSRILRLFWLGLMVVCSLWSMTSCIVQTPEILSSQTKTSATTTPTFQVEITHWLAAANGILIMEDNCLKLRSSDYSNMDFSIVWTPDFSVTIEGDSVKVTSGVVTGMQKVVVLQIGKKVTLGGGTVDELSEAFQKTIPANCTKPYWIVADVINQGQ